MIRSGGIHCCSNASVFLAIADDKIIFEGSFEKYSLSDSTQYSLKNVANEIAHLHHNYAESTDYFRVCIILKLWCMSYRLWT